MRGSLINCGSAYSSRIGLARNLASATSTIWTIPEWTLAAADFRFAPVGIDCYSFCHTNQVPTMFSRVLAVTVFILALPTVANSQKWTSPDGFLSIMPPDANVFQPMPTPPPPFVGLWVSNDETMKFGVMKTQIPPSNLTEKNLIVAVQINSISTLESTKKIRRSRSQNAQTRQY
jgi:hypothetical protein